MFWTNTYCHALWFNLWSLIWKLLKYWKTFNTETVYKFSHLFYCCNITEEFVNKRLSDDKLDAPKTKILQSLKKQVRFHKHSSVLLSLNFFVDLLLF
jgi:hypothetical protein